MSASDPHFGMIPVKLNKIGKSSKALGGLCEPVAPPLKLFETEVAKADSTFAAGDKPRQNTQEVVQRIVLITNGFSIAVPVGALNQPSAVNSTGSKSIWNAQPPLCGMSAVRRFRRCLAHPVKVLSGCHR